jgi:sulfur carrier protein
VRKHGVNVTLETKTIAIVLNGDPRRVPEGLNVAGLLKFLEIDGARVAVELNREIVRKPEWELAEVRDGAQVEVVWFVGGGSMPTVEDTKQQIIKRLNDVPADKLGSVLEYVAFIAMDSVSRSLLTCSVDEEVLQDDAKELIEEAFNEPRPGIPDEQIRRERGL